jgi:predicted 3-demethylubiquinone-9 3-methyltransferase (glyoxalase superfamily)
VEKIVPFLWFDDQAEEAANFYVSVFSKRPGAGTSRVRNITHYGQAGPRPAGMVMTVDFELEGHGITALNGGPEFSFTEALSLAVNCESQQEVDYLWTALSEGGEEGPCGWLKDRYGLSWQIIPVRLTELLNDPDEGRRSGSWQRCCR